MRIDKWEHYTRTFILFIIVVMKETHHTLYCKPKKPDLEVGVIEAVLCHTKESIIDRSIEIIKCAVECGFTSEITPGNSSTASALFGASNGAIYAGAASNNGRAISAVHPVFFCERGEKYKTPYSKDCECDRHHNSETDKNTCTSTGIITGLGVIIVLSIYGLYHRCYQNRHKPCKSYCMKGLPSGEDRDEVDKYRTGVYVVSAEEDIVFTDRFVFELEKRGIQTIFEPRDLAHEAGKNAIELIHRCIDTCSRTLFLMSENFLKDEKCMYTLRQAKGLELAQCRFVIIIIQLKESKKPMIKLSDMYIPNIVFHYPIPPSEEQEFWAELVKCIEDENVHVHIAQTV